MTVRSAPIPRLTRWGVSADADLIYRALCMGGARSGTQIGRELGIAQERVRRALDELAAVGAAVPAAATTRPSRPERVWAPRPPDSVLERLRQRRAPQPARERWHRQVAALSGAGLHAVEHLEVRRWPTRQLARRRLAHLVAAERHEHLVINTEEVFDAESTAAALPVDRAILRRGIRLRVLGLPPVDGDRSSAYAEALGGAGGMYRELSTLPMKLLVFDRRVALFPADPLDFEAGYIEVADDAVVEALASTFHRLWSEARDPTREGVTPIILTPREQALVALLAAGHSDESAAAELRVSVRTIAYTMRALMDRVGVDNRFQLALVLGSTGAAPMPPRTSPGPNGPDDAR
ncbi:hypothetical protein GCM10022251_64140 [Phytohabitans flavus]|uniref:HTH luxR-type domain-containing protein n=1 Tax=Phytohabitans flavus TaxID=1076124 RepID=A0A6F8XV74_9ACTN|nr:helix-turn-helix transcriptional regulator [Phytohabitans flavus]BCB77699.1 hypothetical protein Pflav_041090 [Phytohabitans flavus]